MPSPKLTRRQRGLDPMRLTQLQKLATRRNWCHFILYGMRVQLKVFKKFGCNTANLEKAMEAMFYSIEFNWMKQQEEAKR